MRCERCSWDLKEGDAFCSGCGRSLLGFVLSCADKKIYWCQGIAEQTFSLEIVNSGHGPIYDIALDIDKDWVSLKEKIFPLDSLPPGGRTKLTVIVEPSFAPSDMKKARLTFTSGNAGIQVFDLILLPPPDVQVLFADQEGDSLFLARKEKENSRVIKGELTLRNDTEVGIGDAYSECAFIKKVEIGEPRQLSSKARKLSLTLTLDLSGLPSKIEHHTSFHVKFNDIAGDRVFIFYIRFARPPKLQMLRMNQVLLDAYRTKCVETIPEKIEDLEIKNAGEMPLRIDKVESTGNLLRLAGSQCPPWEIQQNEEFALPLTVSSDRHEAGSYKESLVILSNAENPECCVDFIIEIEKIPVFKEYVAIDFGTTHSCACYYDEGVQDVQTIPLKDFRSQDRAILPSAIQYLEIIDNKATDTIVGETAKQNSFDPQLQLSTVTSIKRKLGSSKPIKVIAAKNREEGVWLPEEIISHIVSYMFGKTQAHVRKAIDRLIITHPSKFGPHQVHGLIRAFELLGIDAGKIQRIQEPIAAAIDFIVKNPHKENYDLMVFDFGGGTVDITLLRVEDRLEGGIRTVNIRTRAREGDNHFGGDDITEALMGILIEKAQKNGNGSLPIEADPMKFTLDEETKVITNRLELIKHSDQMKIRLSRDNRVENQILLNFLKSGDFEQRMVDFSVTREELENRIQDRVRDLIERMKKMLGIISDANLKFLLLSGKSSQIPLVKKLMEENFGKDVIAFPKDLKECVSIGALEYIRIKTTPGKIRINIQEEECTVTNYGYIAQDIYGKSCFQVVIPEGSRLPSAEIELTEEIGMEKGVPRQFRLVEGSRTARANELRTIAVNFLDAPASATEEELRNSKFYMQMNDAQSIRLFARIAGREPVESKFTIEDE
jgi:molecular chaperone DnaK (HSP70)